MACHSELLSDADLMGLRRAAAMAHTVGGISIELRAGGRPLASVVPLANANSTPGDLTGPQAEHPSRPAAGPTTDSCGFRMAVARAWDDRRAGQPVALIGQERGEELEIDWSIARPGHLLGFGGVRTQCGGRLVWAMPSLLPPDALGTVLRDLDDLDDPDEPDAAFAELATVGARVVHDDLLGISIVHLEIGPEHAGRTAPRMVGVVDEILCRLVAANATAEFLDSVSAATA